MPKRRKVQLIALVVLMLLASVAEVISIGSVLPFLSVLINPEKVFDSPWFQQLNQHLQVESAQQILAPITLLFASASIIATAIRVLLLWANTKFSYGLGADLGYEIFRRTLHQPYQVHLARNSSEVINTITTKSQALIAGALSPMLNLLTGSLMAASILLALIVYQPFVAVLLGSVLGATYFVIFQLSRRRLSKNGRKIAEAGGQRIRALQEGLGGIRELIIDRTQEIYCKIYRAADQKLRLAQAQNQFISGSPRYIVEALGISLIAVVAYQMSTRPGGVEGAIPLLGGLALGAQRLLPLLQLLFNSWANIKGGRKSVEDALVMLEQPVQIEVDDFASVIPFQEQIRFERVSFSYAGAEREVFSEVSFSIPKGAKIGVVGKTGEGKSTLLDLLMGLLDPSAGSIQIDEVVLNPANLPSWRARIAHVPQNIFLSDASILENIAFGVDKAKIDTERVKLVAESAQLMDLIARSAQGLHALVGERGTRLSGGQRQRIGIARALYKRSDVLIFDEATSALDHETERSIIEAINKISPRVTILMIAHRLSTLRSCQSILLVGAGRVQLIDNDNGDAIRGLEMNIDSLQK